MLRRLLCFLRGRKTVDAAPLELTDLRVVPASKDRHEEPPKVLRTPPERCRAATGRNGGDKEKQESILLPIDGSWLDAVERPRGFVPPAADPFSEGCAPPGGWIGDS